MSDPLIEEDHYRNEGKNSRCVAATEA